MNFQFIISSKRLFYWLSFAALFLLLTSYYLLHLSVSAQTSPDAIAIRVVPNPDYYSPMRWYEEKIKVKGSPQELMVDGYRAVRDGRTVYINAANYMSGTIYANIYIISYNQEAESATEDIFGKILANWNFNTNLETPGYCTASSTLACINNVQCEGYGYCNSLKADVVRNTRRLSDVADINRSLKNYYIAKGYYPKVSAGSFLANKTLSTWPSWQETLARELGTNLPVDPVNELGICAGFDAKTCWNATSSAFWGDLPSDLATPVSLPPNSQVYVYRVTADGRSYTLQTTAVDPVTVIGEGTELTEIAVDAPPQIIVPPGSTIVDSGTTYINIITYPGLPFNYEISAADADTPDLSPMSLWALNIVSPTAWTPVGGWSGVPTLSATGIGNTKAVSAAMSGKQGYYYFSLTVNDGTGLSDTRYYRVTVLNQPPIISINKTAVSVVVGRNDLVTAPITISAIDPEGNYPLNDLLAGSLPGGLAWTDVSATSYRISGIPTLAASTFTTNYTVYIGDSFGATSTANFSITVVNNAPVFTSTDVTQVRVNNPYSYDVNATDADGHTVRYRFGDASVDPAGFTIDTNTGLISGTPATIGSYAVIIEAYDGYGATTSRGFTLSVTNYCGDSALNNPNDEGVAEECDDGNTDNVDACGNDCKWTCQALPGEPVIVNLQSPGAGTMANISDSTIFSDNRDPNDSTISATGENLKLARVMPTPYIWIANSNVNRVSKIRTFDGPRKTVNGIQTCGAACNEYRGDLVGNFPTGTNPSRTAVNAETGDVWVHNRGQQSVMKFNIDGVMIKNCLTDPTFIGGGTNGGGLAIEKNGDVWAGNYHRGIVVRIQDDNTSACNRTAIVTTGGVPYGLAIDSENNVWVNIAGAVVKILTETATLVIPSYSTPGVYGITVDTSDNVWTGNYGSNVGSFRILSGAAAGVVSDFFSYGGGNTGITIDINGDIWTSGYPSNLVYKRNPITGAQSGSVGVWSSGGTSPHGIAGDSAGQIWAVNLGTSNTRVFDTNGGIIDDYPVASSPVTPYTYSDMTGLNRAMLLRSGIRNYIFDSGFIDQHWGAIDWENVIPADTSVAIAIRASNTLASLANETFDNYTKNAPLPPGTFGRYLEVRITLRSESRGITPVFYNLQSTCTNPKTATVSGCEDDGSGVCSYCTATCDDGSGSGSNTCAGKRLNNCETLVDCTVVNTTPCPADCTLPENLVCSGSTLGAPDTTNLDMSSLPANYSINGGWGYTSVFEKPSSFSTPVTVPHSLTIVVAQSNKGYQGRIWCSDGIIYKRYASSTLTTENTCP
jgi:hypothetical protein